MQAGKIVFAVGHSHWGKSSLLRAMTDGNPYQKKVTIMNTEFFVRRMSNDDQPKGYVEFMRALIPQSRPNVVAAFCPKFSSNGDTDPAILQPLQHKGYELFFWVMRHQQGPGGGIVTDSEIDAMHKAGKTEVFLGKTSPPILAEKFIAFVSAVTNHRS
jgi:hypothetical protein